MHLSLVGALVSACGLVALFAGEYRLDRMAEQPTEDLATAADRPYVPVPTWNLLIVVGLGAVGVGLLLVVSGLL